MKVATAYQLIKGFELTPIQFVELHELMSDDVRAITMPCEDPINHKEIEIEKRLIEKRILVLPYGRQNSDRSD